MGGGAPLPLSENILKKGSAEMDLRALILTI
jgi:hypothetical protein